MANATRIADVSFGPYIGKYTGTTAAQNIHIGFKPAYIRAWNATDGTTIWEWYKDDTSNLMTIVTTAGPVSAAIAVAQVDDGTTIGFSLPSNSTVNTNTKVFKFFALPE